MISSNRARLVLSRISSYDRTGGNIDFIRIAPGKTKTLAEISGTGIIRRFYVAPFGNEVRRFGSVVGADG